MKRACLLLVLLLVPRLVAAQTHPCDQAPQLTFNVLAGQTKTLLVCQDGKGVGSEPEVITSWAMYDNGTKTTPVPVVGTTSTVSGRTLYSFTYVVPNAAGTRTIQFAAIDGVGEGPKQVAPFVLTVSLPPTVPTAPIGVGVQ